MSTVQNTTAAGSLFGVSAPAAATTATSATTTSSDIQDRFLKLLVTQLKNQDPLNPMDNAQLTSQLSQISTVTGIEKLNTTMQSLSSSFLSSQSLQSSALIGHTVYSDGNTLTLASGKSAGGGIDLSAAATDVTVNVIGPAGNVVRQISLGARNSGLVDFKWDGLNDAGGSVAAGKYSFEVAATSGARKVTASPLVAGTVSGVTLAADGAHLSVSGVGDLRMDQVKRIM